MSRPAGPDRYELIRRRLAEAGLGSGRAPAPDAADDAPAPLSHPQLGIWLAAHLHPASAAYSMPTEHRIRGPLDVPALAAALRQVVVRQDVLRSRFVPGDGDPVQCAVAAGPVWQVHDVRALPPAARAERLARVRHHHRAVPFALADEPPLRVDLVRLADETAVLLLTVHHIAADGWSFDILHRELAAAYRGADLGPLPLRYADFARRQRAAATGAATGAATDDGVRRQLADASALRLPDVLDSPVGPTQPGATIRVPVPSGPAGKVTTLARERGRSRFAVLTAALAAVLARYAGRADVVIATPLSGRTRPDTLDLVGVFLNTALLRIDLAGDPSFQTLTDRVHAAVQDALRYEHEPVEALADQLGGRGTPALPYRVLVTHRADTPGLSLAGLEVEPQPVEHGTAKVDLRVEFLERVDGLDIDVTHSTDLLPPAAANRFGQHLRRALEFLVEHPRRPVSALPLEVPPGTAGPDDGRSADPVVDRLRAMIATRAGAPAIRGPGCELTYAELGGRCAVLAGLLDAAGPTGPVAVHGGNDLGSAVAMVAVLLAGRTVVPLDRDLPLARRTAMAAAAGVRHVIEVGSTERTRLPGSHPDRVTDLAAATGLPTPPRALRPGPAGAGPDADDPAYIVFTSGTTGGPRGLLGSYGGLTHFLGWQRDTFAVGPDDRVPFLTSISFDVVFRELLLPLVSGGVLCVPGPGREDPDELLRWLAETEVTLLHAVPTNLAFWLDRAVAGRTLPRVRALFSAGEPLTAAMVRRWRARAPRSTVVNLYGPAETSLAKCGHVVPDPPLAGPQPVGRPLPGVRVRIAPADGTAGAVPTAVAGEIVLSPPFRLLGYLDGDPDGRFRTYDGDGRPWFRTGDLGRQRPDGLVEVLGRLDRQVKIRGVRVEPDGVAAVLARHPSVAACAVRTWPRDDGHLMLTGYVVADRPAAGLPETLLAHLAASLPTAMVPERLVVLAELPRTSRGKVDHAALPEPGPGPGRDPDAGDPFPGSSAVARVVIGTWREMLGVSRARPADDFFRSGGHSLLGLQLTARLRQRLEVDLQVADLFGAPTLGELVALAERRATTTPAGTDPRGPRRRTPRPAPTQAED